MMRDTKTIRAFLTKIRDFLKYLPVSLMLWFMASPLYAEDIMSSKIAKGVEKLLQDATSWLLILAPIVTVVAIAYYFIRMAISDEMDHRKWSTRITTAIISGVGVIMASVIIKVVLAYFQ